ncbi:SET domain-containing protein [Nemania serpens]|nr:SET domain-containing protein [Nemania serpens]
MEEAMRRHFFHHTKDAEGLEAEKQRCHWCQIRTFATHSQYPITIVNNEDDSMIQPNFRFMDTSIRANDIEPTRKEFLTGCECEEDVDCKYSGCSCLQDVEDNSSGDEDGDDDDDDDDDDDENEDNETASVDSFKADSFKAFSWKKAYAYHAIGPRAGQLRAKILTSRKPIYECHESCICSPACPNRVVERGRKVPLQIFRTKNRGWGVRCTVDIKKGQFVDKYMGEIITGREANQRRAQSHIAQMKDVYLFALDKFSNPDSFDERLRGPPLEVDGEFVSGPTRFINHSCDPNLRIFARVGDHADKHIHDLAFFAIRHIPRGEELTFDYIDGVDEEDNDALDPEKRKDMARCLCGSKKCRGYLW